MTECTGKSCPLIKKLLDSKSLDCQLCKKPLQIPVFLVDDRGNLCESCTLKHDWNSTRNEIFNVLLEDLTIPCTNVIGRDDEISYEHFEQHLKFCKYRPLNSLIKPAGQLLLFGLTNWDHVGDRIALAKNLKKNPNLYVPHLFTDLKVRFAVSGCVAGHSVLATDEDQAMTFGRNKWGQLGLGHTDLMVFPTIVPVLENMNVIDAACGRNHTLFLTDTGTVYACGDNRSGQCGIGKHNQPTVLVPTKINYHGPPIIKVGCGAEFSVILDIKGGLHSFGLPEFGQLGHNTEGKYFKTSTKLGFNFETSPKRIILYIDKSREGHVAPVDVAEIVDFACGTNHTVAIDNKKRAFSWGFGGYGRLGHAEQKDELVPRFIKYFEARSMGVRSIHCGQTYSLAVTDSGTLFMFGQTNREANMYPKPVSDLAGSQVTRVAAGFSSVIVLADDSVFSWGVAPTYGELGLGETPKSSCAPKEVTKLADVKEIIGLSMGHNHTLVIAQNDTPEQKAKLKSFETYDPLNPSKGNRKRKR